MRLLRSPPPAPGQRLWIKAAAAAFIGLIVPFGLGYAGLFLSDAPVSGLAKDGGGRSLAGHLTLVSTALFAMPLLAWLALPLVVPLIWASVTRGFAGPASLIALPVLVGLPLIHLIFNADVTTENPSVLPHIVTALALCGGTGWVWLWFAPGRAKVRRARP